MAEMMKRERPRIGSLDIDKGKIIDRIKRFYADDNANRSDDIDARLQRYAKYRMWTEGRDWPWENACDASIPDMMTASMRLQDTLHNAVMSQRPCVMAKATKKIDEEKTETVDHLIDYQMFVEQPGEEIVGTLAHDFVNEGLYTAYVPWVKETRNVVDLFSIGPVPQEGYAADFFRTWLEGKFPRAELDPGKDGWDWTIREGKKKHRASFFTVENGDAEVEIEREAIRYEGPRVIPKDYQDVGHPARCENLQIPGPSNPMGASHVWLRDFPSVDEIKRLASGDKPFYDMLTKEDRDKLKVAKMDDSNQEQAHQKDVMAGHQEMKDKAQDVQSHEQLTRLMVFDCYDIDGDGKDEDVIWWYIVETETLLRARYLTQMFPAQTPTRPLAEAHLFPVPGRRASIGLLEMMEGLHDMSKMFFDLMGDSGTMATTPFGFYRASSNMRPEVIRLWPGEMYPLNDPQRDVHFPSIGNQNQAFGFNMVTLLQQMEERLTTIGELQLGRVPQGKASALRTVSGMQTVLSQGDARPERVLRRFFMGLTQIWRLIHNHNQVFLPKGKQFLINGYKDPVKDPYRSVDDLSKVQGAFMFDFSANALNTSKEAMQQNLDAIMAIYVTPLAIQMGVVQPDGVYRLFRDKGKAHGLDADRYLSPPTANAMVPKIFAEDAIAMMMAGQAPVGDPAEGAAEHLAKLQAFMQSDTTNYDHPTFGEVDVPAFALMHEEYVSSVFGPYLQRIAQKAQQEQQQQALLQAVQQFGQGNQKPGMPGPAGAPQPGAQANPQLNGGELLDETLPSAGGGGNVAVAA